MRDELGRRQAIAALGALAGAACMPVSTVRVPPELPVRGARNPRLVVQEVGDFQCPFCAEVAPDVNRLMDRYADRVALVWRNYPLKRHANAELAAEAALEIRAQLGDDAFWQYHDVLFRNQQALEGPDLVRYAEAFAIDSKRFSRALEVGVHQSAVARDRRAIESLNIPGFGVPAFLVGEDAFVGSYGYEELVEIVEDAL